MALDLMTLGKSLGGALTNVGTYSAQAAQQANAVSRQAQSAQGAFNQNSANIANSINDQSMQSQYAFNSAMMNNANQFTANAWNEAAEYNSHMWEKAADFNREMWEAQRDYNTAMWEKAANFNREEAEKNRAWQQQMEATKYQRAVKDMAAAGLNPILAATGGGISAGSIGGSMASVGAGSVGGTSMSPSSMSSAQGQMAQGGLLGSHSASESNYMGQMEYLSGTLGLISAVIGGMSSAADAAGQLGDAGKGIIEGATEALTGGEAHESYENYKKLRDSDSTWEKIKNGIKYIWDNRTGGWIIDKAAKSAITTKSDRDQFLRMNDYNKSWNKYSKPKG